MAEEVDDEMLDEMEAQQANEEYKIWKKNTPFLYDLVITHALEWPSLTVQWLPNADTPTTSHDSALHYLLLGTHTSGDEPNYLIRARVHLPLQDVEGDALDYQHDTSDPGSVDLEYCKVQIIQQITHDGEVNRARYMPQKSAIIATKTVSAETYVFDYTKHPSKPSQQCSPYLRLQGHIREGYGLSWSTLREGYLLSGSDDARICLWDINSAATSNGILRAMQTLRAHSSVVEDVAWHSSLDYLFGSAGDDRRLLIWDLRALKDGPSQSVEAHEAEVNCLAFNPFNEYMLATGSSDRTLALHDRRKLSERLHTFSNHMAEVYQIGWNPKNETILASSSADKRVIVWDLSRIGEEQTPEDAEDGPPELLFIHGGHTSKISDFSWNQQADWMIASVAEDNVLQIWQMAESIYQDEDDGMDWSLIQS